ncbi:hypothetical protein [Planctomicrobium sp. SH664]|uniref:hypothetical protein n=1 Tax=Planctomicrobium sp. SH664 TaxID=3448125 RepID=UPI003F5CA7C5
MTSSVMVERNSFGASASPAACAPGAAPATNWCVVPRCEIRIEKCKDGCKIVCSCEDEVACSTLQNLCQMLSSGQCSLCCQFNGVTCLDCKLCCGHCKYEPTKDGCCITCTSGDAACCQMIQACCEAVANCIKNGCTCFLCFNGTPVCCCC